jgi:8-oxo-dGTP pyrophosphatase MutT (NUDIX family)
MEAMPDKINASKVLCYIVRDGRLLVFRHVDYDLEQVGIQVPAGSIRQGESPEDAALREAHEETSLSQLSVARKLGETTYDLSPYRYEIQHRHVFQLQVHEPTQQRWPSQELHDGQQPPTRLECFWIPLRNAHVLQAGQGALIGAIAEE